MLALVIVACLGTPATDISPPFQTCSLVRLHQQFDTEKSCNAGATVFTKELQKDKRFRVTGHKCVDSQKLDAAVQPPKPQAPNPVDPKLKPLTPEQKQQGAESL